VRFLRENSKKQCGKTKQHNHSMDDTSHRSTSGAECVPGTIVTLVAHLPEKVVMPMCHSRYVTLPE
jgi:hypothetical protein